MGRGEIGEKAEERKGRDRAAGEGAGEREAHHLFDVREEPRAKVSPNLEPWILRLKPES